MARTIEERLASNLICPECLEPERDNGFYEDGSDPDYFICNCCNASFHKNEAKHLEVPMGLKHVTIVVEHNTEDPEVGGFFASFLGGWGRGHGSTEESAMFSLVLLYAENEGIDLSEQANDVVGCSAIHNDKLEQALGRRYGGDVEYTNRIPALGL